MKQLNALPLQSCPASAAAAITAVTHELRRSARVTSSEILADICGGRLLLVVDNCAWGR
jgi:hypothetical protein